MADTLVRVGRHEIILDDARLLGNIGWRNNAQSFDSVLLQYAGFEGYTLHVAGVRQINSIFSRISTWIHS
ncbi:MAG TPA: hypothetical protein DCR55_02425 [Lentisphaeria bacterium]|nr:hypothetical protein [Lentisphaeria bacterium]